MEKNIKLLSENELIWSAIVANNRMNRKRQANGVNSYENEVGFRPEDWLNNKLAQQASVSWLDMCCGQGNALLQVAQAMEKQNMQDKAQLCGLDLVRFFAPIPTAIHCLTFDTGSAITWQPSQHYDLITCIHGIHYMGDKLLAIKKMTEALAPDGLFVASFDTASILVNNEASPKVVTDWLAAQGIAYNAKKKLIQAEGQNCALENFAGQYLGADDEAGKNYTGQEAVNSYYEI